MLSKEAKASMYRYIRVISVAIVSIQYTISWSLGLLDNQASIDYILLLTNSCNIHVHMYIKIIEHIYDGYCSLPSRHFVPLRSPPFSRESTLRSSHEPILSLRSKSFPSSRFAPLRRSLRCASVTSSIALQYTRFARIFTMGTVPYATLQSRTHFVTTFQNGFSPHQCRNYSTEFH